MRPEVERIKQRVPFVDEGDHYDDRDEEQARSFLTPVLFVLLFVFLVAVIYAVVAG